MFPALEKELIPCSVIWWTDKDIEAHTAFSLYDEMDPNDITISSHGRVINPLTHLHLGT